MGATSQKCLKKNMNGRRPSERPPVRGNMSKRLGGTIGCKYKTSSWRLIGFLDGVGEKPTIIPYTYYINSTWYLNGFPDGVGEKPTVILYTFYINRHAEPPSITKQKRLYDIDKRVVMIQ